MSKLILLLLIPFLMVAQELEVYLPTQAQSTPVYLCQIASSHKDTSYFSLLRSVLEFDLNTNGFCSVVSTRQDLENELYYPDVRSTFNGAQWKKGRIPFCLTMYINEANQLTVTAFHVDKGSSKKYPEITLLGDERDRENIHMLADTIQKDLFGKMGVASLRLLYTKRAKHGANWVSEIWTSDSDGGNARQVTFENSYCLSPYFLPNSSHEFFYVSEKTGQLKIYKASLQNPQGQLLIDMRGNQALAAMSKKGSQIAFISDVAGRPDLFLQTLDVRGQVVGKAKQLFSAERATQATPTFSPDGKQVAFVSDKDGPPRIFLLNVNAKNTKHPRLLTKKNRENTSPSWSPDGTKLAYSAKVDGVRQIWIYDFRADEETQLTYTVQNKENPSWAPDSLHLVYNTECDDSSELFVINLNQREPIQITSGSGQKRFASWQTVH